MTDHSNDKLAGLLYGSLIGDSLALGAHWIYDQEKMQAEFGRVTELLTPRPDSYHPDKKAGQQTHYGDQALALMGSIQARGGFTAEGFAGDWRAMWSGYPDYFDHATKETLANLAAGTPLVEAGSHSQELGGAARIAPLLVALRGEPVETAVEAARAQTRLTHTSKIAGDSAEFLARLVHALLDDATLSEAISAAIAGSYDELDVPAILQAAKATSSLDIPAAAKALGLACPASQALPTLIMLLERCGYSFETAMIENVMAGGDNAARALALGMIMGAAHGKSAIPDRWLEGLEAAPRVEAFLRRD